MLGVEAGLEGLWRRWWAKSAAAVVAEAVVGNTWGLLQRVHAAGRAWCRRLGRRRVKAAMVLLLGPAVAVVG